VRALDLVDVVALAAEVSDVEPPKLLELLDTPEVGALLAEAQAPLPPHEAAAALLVGLVEIGPLPTGNRRLALLAALHLLGGYGLEVELDPHATRDLLAAVQAGGPDAPSVAIWLGPHVMARDPLDCALRDSLSTDAWRAIGLAVDRARRHRRLLASPADLLLGLLREGTGPAALATGADDTTAEVVMITPADAGFEVGTRTVMALALRAAVTLGHRQITGGHLLLGLLDGGHAGLLPAGVDATDVRRRVLDLLGLADSPERTDLGARLSELIRRLRTTDPAAAVELEEVTELLRTGVDRTIETVLAWRGELSLTALGQDEAVDSLLALQRPPGPVPAGSGEAGLLARYVADVARYPKLSRAEEAELFAVIKAAVEPEAALSERRLIQSNLELVVTIARGYHASGLPMLDLIQEGNLGLMQAVPRYDPTKGYRFTTFATWWIRNYIQRAAGRPRA
jgi:hypothetical protein